MIRADCHAGLPPACRSSGVVLHVTWLTADERFFFDGRVAVAQTLLALSRAK
jgi:hypothetical protein